MTPFRNFGSDLWAAYDEWSKDDGALLASAIAYYLAVAFFPLLLILLSALGFFLEWTDSGQDARKQVLNAVEEQISPELRTQVETVLSSVQQNASLGGPIGVLTLLITAIAIFAQFDAAFDRIWNITEPKTGIWQSIWHVLVVRLKAFLMLIALGIVIVAVFLSGMIFSAAEATAEQLVPISPWASWASQLLITSLLNAAIFTLLYRIVPRTEVPWNAALAGGILAAVIWEIGRQILSAFIIGQKYSSAYGVVGAFLAIMLWCYYGMSVVFFGAEFTQCVAKRTRN